MDNIVLKTTREWAADYNAADFVLIALYPGLKKPIAVKGKNWGDYPVKAENFEDDQGIGLIHAASRTCVLDFDDLTQAGPYLLSHGIDMQALLDAPNAVQIVSGRTNRAKLLYRLPDDVAWLASHLALGFLELRCAGADGSHSIQDVLPPSMHPGVKTKTKEVLMVGQQYTWGGSGSYTDLPELPASVLAHWRGLVRRDAHKNVISAEDSGLGDLPFNQQQISDVASALSCLDADDYYVWRDAGMGLKAQGEVGFVLWDDWAQQESRSYDYENNRKQWDGFQAKSITYRSIFNAAAKEGWTNPAKGVSKVEQAKQAAKLTMQELKAKPNDRRQIGKKLDTSVNGPAYKEKIFYVGDRIPERGISLIYGDGGSGKSFTSLTMAVCIALGLDFGDLKTTQGKVYIVSAEDENNDVTGRLDHVCSFMEYPDGRAVLKSDLTDDVFEHIDITKEEIVALYSDGATATFEYLSRQIADSNADVVFLDNISKLFAGDESSRFEVMDFVQSVNVSLIPDYVEVLADSVNSAGRAVVLIGHTSKSNIAKQAAGSAAWSSGARDTEFVEKVESVEGKPDRSTITLTKSNHSRAGTVIVSEWRFSKLKNEDGTPRKGGTFVPLRASEGFDSSKMTDTGLQAARLLFVKTEIIKAFITTESKGITVYSSENASKPAYKVLKSVHEVLQNVTEVEFLEAFLVLKKEKRIDEKTTSTTRGKDTKMYVLVPQETDSLM